MKSRQIQFTAPGIAELVEIDIPAPAAGQVTVKLAVSTVSSGTERANLIGDPSVSPHGKSVWIQSSRISSLSR